MNVFAEFFVGYPEYVVNRNDSKKFIAIAYNGKCYPAVSSAPFVATLVDVTGLIIYFSVAFLLLSGKLL